MTNRRLLREIWHMTDLITGTYNVVRVSRSIYLFPVLSYCVWKVGSSPFM